MSEKLPISWDGSKELIDWHDEAQRRTWLSNALITLVVSNDKEYWAKNADRAGGKNRSAMEVVCTIDGVPVRLTHLVDRLAEDFDRQVRVAARDMVKGSFRKVEDMLHRMEQAMRSEFPELNLDEDE